MKITAVYQNVNKELKSRLIFNFHADFGMIYLKNCIEFHSNFWLSIGTSKIYLCFEDICVIAVSLKSEAKDARP